MTEYGSTWELTRKRFDDAVAGLTSEQLNWRMFPGALTLGEAAIHVAGVELLFVSQLLGQELDGDAAKIRQAATDGVVNGNPFPFTASEITPQTIAAALETGRAAVVSIISNPSDEIRSRQIVSALGPVIDGNGAFARLAYHPGYHQGQAHLVKTAPGYPA